MVSFRFSQQQCQFVLVLFIHVFVEFGSLLQILRVQFVLVLNALFNCRGEPWFAIFVGLFLR